MVNYSPFPMRLDLSTQIFNEKTIRIFIETFVTGTFGWPKRPTCVAKEIPLQANSSGTVVKRGGTGVKRNGTVVKRSGTVVKRSAVVKRTACKETQVVL